MGTNEGDLVFAPFGGSGTTYAVAKMLKRKWIGTEFDNCDIIKSSLLHAEKDIEQLVKIREECEGLFPPKIAELRKKNGFWICEDFQQKNNDIEF